MRLIDADKLKPDTKTYTLGYSEEQFYSQAAIDSAPTVDADPVKHGYWATGEIITFGGRTASPLFCSECLKFACGEPWTYCPNCGAKMDATNEVERTD